MMRRESTSRWPLRSPADPGVGNGAYALCMCCLWCPLLFAGGCYYRASQIQLPADAATGDTVIDAQSPCSTDPRPDGGHWIATEVQGINSITDAGTGAEDDPSCTCDRNTIVFASTRNGSASALFIAQRGHDGSFTVSELTEPNSVASDKGSPEISRDGATLYFTAGDTNMRRVYVSHLEPSSGTWTTSVVASTSLGFPEDVAISPDGQTAVVANGGRLYLETGGPDFAFTNSHEIQITPPNDSIPNRAAPSVMDDAKVVYFHDGPFNARKIYRLVDGTPSALEVTELNAEGMRNSAPFVLEGERYMLFARDGRIYEATYQPSP